MTADDDSESESENSTSRTPTRTEQDGKPIFPLISALRKQEGWATRKGIAYSCGLELAEVDEHLDLGTSTDEVDRHDLGDVTLVTVADTDPQEAVAEYSDAREKQWRELTDDRLPNIDERSN